jgi:hypothetical protein
VVTILCDTGMKYLNALGPQLEAMPAQVATPAAVPAQ